MTSLAALSMTALFVSLSQQKSSEAIQKAKISNARALGDAVNMSNLSAFKGLMSDARVAGVYQPVLYAANYFDTQWKLSKNVSIPQSHVELQQGKVMVPFLSSQENPEDFAAVFKNQTSVLAKFKQNYLMQIVRINPNPLHPYFIESVDVRAEAVVGENHSQTAKTMVTTGRIALRAPTPRALSLWIKGPGQSSFTQNLGSSGSGLPAGDYIFQVRASGVVHYAELNLDGQLAILGLDPSTGAIVHAANNIRADQVVMGEYKKTLAPAASAAAGSAVWQTCEIAMSPGVAGSSVVGVDVRVAAFGVDGLEASGVRLEKTLYISSGSAAAATGPAQIACESSCPIQYFRDVAQVPGALMKHFDKGLLGVKDFHQLDTEEGDQTRQLIKNGGQGLVCSNHELMAQAMQQASGMLPSELYAADSARFNKIQSETLHLKDYIAYLAPKCERQVIGTRDSCGCFAADTRIRMADGTERSIDQIRQGDRVWNPRLQKPAIVARVIAGPEKYPLFRIKTAHAELLVTGAHPFLTDQGLRKAHQLQRGAIIIDGLVKIPILGIATDPPPDEAPIVWNLSLAGASDHADEHFVLANGVMTGDLHLQEQLEGQDL